MQSVKIILFAICTFISSVLFAQTQKTDIITVYGECGMCKNRIQKALNAEGISSAVWNTDTKNLIVTYNPDVITNDDIQKKVATVGHDTEKYAAPDEVYNKLPGCCLYERKKDKKDKIKHTSIL